MSSRPRASALVTGAGQGIGAATARELGHRGFHVILLGRNEKNLSEIAKSLPSAEVLLCDLDQADDVERAARRAVSNPDVPLEVLINNAGIFTRHSTAEGTDALWEAQFRTNLLAPVRLTRAVLPFFASRRKGSIVNVSSTLGLKPTADTSAYSAVKAALVNWTSALALEQGPHGVRANCVCPGLVDTPIHPFHSLPLPQKTVTLEQLSGLQPLGRIGSPEEVARAIAFLASDDSSWTTGAILSVDGGINLT